MNKRILKLFNEAGFHQPEMERLGIEDKFEKFAQLIVQECAHLVGGHTKENEFGTDVKEAYEEITKHFGVER